MKRVEEPGSACGKDGSEQCGRQRAAGARNRAVQARGNSRVPRIDGAEHRRGQRRSNTGDAQSNDQNGRKERGPEFDAR